MKQAQVRHFDAGFDFAPDDPAAEGRRSQARPAQSGRHKEQFVQKTNRYMCYIICVDSRAIFKLLESTVNPLLGSP